MLSFGSSSQLHDLFIIGNTLCLLLVVAAIAFMTGSRCTGLCAMVLYTPSQSTLDFGSLPFLAIYFNLGPCHWTIGICQPLLSSLD